RSGRAKDQKRRERGLRGAGRLYKRVFTSKEEDDGDGRKAQDGQAKFELQCVVEVPSVVVLGGGSFGTAMAAHVANKKTQMEVSMLVRDPAVW
ncbi:Glycerol-3-phosphate dehydrogenase, partial [Theobroma cacao]